VNAVLRAGNDSLSNMMDACLENRVAKTFTDPMLNVTEKYLAYWIPQSSEQQLTTTQSSSSSSSSATTLHRIYDINSRVAKHFYQTTFTQLAMLHAQFDNVILQIKALISLLDLHKLSKNAPPNSLVSQCVKYMDAHKLSYQGLNDMVKSSYERIMTQTTSLLESYMALIQKFPISINGTKMRQTVDDLQLKLASVTPVALKEYLTIALDQLTAIQSSLVRFTQQLYQVVMEKIVSNVNLSPITSTSNSTTTTITTTAPPASSAAPRSKRNK